MFACVRLRMNLFACECLWMHARACIWAKRTTSGRVIELPAVVFVIELPP